MPIFKEVYEPNVAQGTNMAEYSKTFPECDSPIPAPSAGDIGYIGSSESVGCGNEPGDHLAPFSNEEFPNEESGEGKGPA